MKKPIILFVLALALFLASDAWAQNAPHGLGARLTYTNFQYPISKQWVGNDFHSGAEIEYIHSLNKFLGLGIPLRLGRAAFPLDDMGTPGPVTSILGLDATLHLKYFKSSSFIYPYLYGGIGVVSEDLKSNYLSAPVGLGLNFKLANNTYLSTKAEYRFGFTDFRDNIMLGAGLLLNFGEGEVKPPPIADRDGDGVPDSEDKCPDVPGLAIFAGCPDTDGDGIPDHEDDCPTEAGPAATRGCPDRDGDGIPDKDDDCPDQPGPVELRGCPDRDGDGIPDKDDDCPDQAGPRATRGCPDRDGDGVPDKDDKCPDTPGPASNFGCPEIEEEDKAILDLAVKNVQFETGKANLLTASFAVLDRVAELMRKYPDYKLRISGHTDSVGDAAANQRLSEARAKTCFDYLIARGVAPSRMIHQGFGESRPIADNRFKEGRDQNRRVEFELYLD